MVQLASYLRRVLCKTRLIFPRINGSIIILYIFYLSTVDGEGRGAYSGEDAY